MAVDLSVLDDGIVNLTPQLDHHPDQHNTLTDGVIALAGLETAVEFYGAVGDGTEGGGGTDDTAALQLALDSARNVRLTPGKAYRISATLAIGAGVTFNLAGGTLLKDWDQGSTQTYAIKATGTVGGGVALSADVAQGDHALNVGANPSTASIAAGDLVLIRDNQYKFALGGNPFGRNEEIARVKAVSNAGALSTITLSERTIGAYVAATSGDAYATAAGVGTAGSGTVSKLNAVAAARILGGTIRVTAGKRFSGGFLGSYTHGMTVQGLEVVGVEKAQGIAFNHSADARVLFNTVRDAQADLTAASHYGIQFYESCTGFLALGNTTRGIRENIVTNNCRHGVFAHNFDYGALDNSWNCHGSGNEDILFLGNTSMASQNYGFIVGFASDSWQDKRISVVGNRVVAAGNHCVAIGGDATSGHRPQDVTVRGNEFHDLLNRGVSVAYADNVTISDNHFKNYRVTARRAIRAEQCGGLVDIRGNEASGLGNNYLIEWVDCPGVVRIFDNIGQGGTSYYLVGSNGTSPYVWVGRNVTDVNLNSFAGTEHLDPNWFNWTSGGPSAGSATGATQVLSDPSNPFLKLIKGADITAFIQLTSTILSIYAGTDDAHLFSALQVDTSGNLQISQNVGFHGNTPQARPTITGSKGGNAALQSLLGALAAYGLVTDATT